MKKETTLDAAPDSSASGGTRKRTKREREPKSAGRRVAFWTGCLLLLAGVGVLLWLAWVFWGTDWISYREIHHEVKAFKQDSPTGPAVLLEIPRFGADYVVPVNEGTSEAVLAKGVAHFLKTGPDGSTIGPGQVGNYALAGHRVTNGQPFANLPSLRPGDKVYVITHTVTYVYVMDTNPNQLNIPFTDVWVLGMDPVNPDGGPQAIQQPDARILTLATCAGVWTWSPDRRMVAFGHLLTTYPTNQANPTQITQ